MPSPRSRATPAKSEFHSPISYLLTRPIAATLLVAGLLSLIVPQVVQRLLRTVLPAPMGEEPELT